MQKTYKPDLKLKDSDDERALIGVKYDPDDPWSDFKNLLTKANDQTDPDFTLLQNSLFIYNENSIDFLRQTVVPGGGNACIRPWRADTEENQGKYWVYSLGIPTDNSELSHTGVANVLNYLNKNPQIDKVFWSSEGGKLGLGIFSGIESAEKISAAIPRILVNMLMTLGFRDVYYRDETHSDYQITIRSPDGGVWFDDLPNFLRGATLF